MSHTDQVLQYLQAHGKVRSAEIVKEVSVPRRDVFRALAILCKRNLVIKEGFHPKIFYSAAQAEVIAAQAEVIAPEAASNPIVLKKPQPQADSSELTRLRQDLAAANEKSSKRHSELHDYRNKFNRCDVDLKSKDAMVHYQEDQIKQLKDNAHEYHREIQKLRQDIEDLQIKLREKR